MMNETTSGDDCPWRDEERLRELYWVRGMTLKEIAEEFDLGSEVTVLRWMDRFGIDRRPSSEGNVANLSNEGIEFIQGLLLGDGHLSERKGGLSAQYEHSDSSCEYLEWLSAKLSEFGLEQAGTIRDNVKGGYGYRTLSYRDLLPIRKRWYPSSNREIPTNIRITPTMAKNWYVGDGHLMKNGINIAFSYSYNPNSRADIREILEPLSKEGIEYTLPEGGIRIVAKSVDDFLRYTLSDSAEIPPTYSYKFPERIR